MKILTLYILALITTFSLHASDAAASASSAGAAAASSAAEADDLVPESWGCRKYYAYKSDVDPGFRTPAQSEGFGEETLLQDSLCIEEAEFLLRIGVDPKEISPSGRGCLHTQDDLSIVRLLISRGADPHQVWLHGYPTRQRKPIHCACDLELTKFYVEECGADPKEGIYHFDESSGAKFLMEGAFVLYSRSVDELKFALDVGCDPYDIEYSLSCTTNMLEPDNLSIITYFRYFVSRTQEHHISLAPEEDYCTFPHISDIKECVDIMKSHGIDLTVKAPNGNTILHKVNLSSYVINLFVAEGVAFDDENSKGLSPLFCTIKKWAAEKSRKASGMAYITGFDIARKEAAEALILHGARVELGDKSVKASGMFTDEEYDDIMNRRNALVKIKRFFHRWKT